MFVAEQQQQQQQQQEEGWTSCCSEEERDAMVAAHVLAGRSAGYERGASCWRVYWTSQAAVDVARATLEELRERRKKEKVWRLTFCFLGIRDARGA